MSTLASISLAALSVKVNARISPGLASFSAISQAIRRVMTVVFPVPAPATIRSGPFLWVTAAVCSGLRPARISVGMGIIILYGRRRYGYTGRGAEILAIRLLHHFHEIIYICQPLKNYEFGKKQT